MDFAISPEQKEIQEQNIQEIQKIQYQNISEIHPKQILECKKDIFFLFLFQKDGMYSIFSRC